MQQNSGVRQMSPNQLIPQQTVQGNLLTVGLGVGLGVHLNLAVGSAAVSRPARKALHQLLYVLKKPNTREQRKQIFQILKKNPQLMSAFLKQRHIQQQQQQQQHQMQGVRMQVDGGMETQGCPPPPGMMVGQGNTVQVGPGGMQQQQQNFSVCVTCYEKDGHLHKIEKLGLDDGSSPADQKQANPQAKRLSIQRCIQSLVHACQCQDANCRLQSCQKMKIVLQHTKICKRKTNASCLICKQLIALCCYHAKNCEETECPVPFCSKIKHKLMQQQLQQRLRQAQLLRRRMAMATQNSRKFKLSFGN